MGEQNREMYAYLDRLSTQRLEEMLLADLEDDSCRDTSEVIFHILEVLRNREDTAMPAPDADRAWEDFQRYYNTPEGRGQALYPCQADRQEPEKKPKPRHAPLWRTLRIAAATVALLLALMIGAQASGVNVFGALAQWTSEKFHFGTGQSEIESENYQQFLTLLVQNSIEKELAPTWCPAGFVASEPIIKISDSIISIQISFSNMEGNIFYIGIDRYTSQPNPENKAFEKDDISVEQYLSHGKTFYIFPNESYIMATWAENSLLETIWGDLSEDNIKAIIDSIGGS